MAVVIGIFGFNIYYRDPILFHSQIAGCDSSMTLALQLLSTQIHLLEFLLHLQEVFKLSGVYFRRSLSYSNSFL